jgi:hypothetical protein
METKYVGTRTREGCKVEKDEEGKEPAVLDPRLDLWNHSPTGLEWSYGGSGPAQTALALLADATGDDRLAVSLHQDFKRQFVARFPKQGFTMTEAEIQRWAEDEAKRLDLSDWDDD